MKRKNKFIGDISDYKEENLNINEEELNNSCSFRSTYQENIINELKQKGFNNIQIDDILDTLMRNSINDKFIFEKKDLNLQQTPTIDTDLAPIKIGIKKGIYKKDENNNNNSKYKNSFIIKTENAERLSGRKNKSKQNCVKLYINASSTKEKACLINSYVIYLSIN